MQTLQVLRPTLEPGVKLAMKLAPAPGLGVKLALGPGPAPGPRVPDPRRKRSWSWSWFLSRCVRLCVYYLLHKTAHCLAAPPPSLTVSPVRPSLFRRRPGAVPSKGGLIAPWGGPRRRAYSGWVRSLASLACIAAYAASPAVPPEPAPAPPLPHANSGTKGARVGRGPLTGGG